MHSILILGGGKIGSAIAHLLAHSGHYQVYLADARELEIEHPHPHLKILQMDVGDTQALYHFAKQYTLKAVLSCLPYFCNVSIAEFAKQHHCHYFDLTEDTKTTEKIAALAEKADTAFIPQCGLAPGFINIVAHNLMQHFDKLDTVKLRCGALPEYSSNALQYALTWSTEGLINEYGNPCHAVEQGKFTEIKPLADLEQIQIDGANYEAFNTSGGLSSLAQTYQNKINTLNYKTIRYPGHCEKMRFLMNGLKLNEDRDTLKHILENAIPTTQQDIVIVYVSASGQINGELTKENYVNKFYPKEVNGKLLTAIQLTTAASACAIVDLICNQDQKNQMENYSGWVRQEQFELSKFLANPFGQYLKKEV